MNGQSRTSDRRSLVNGVVAALVLGLVWLLPSAYQDSDASTSYPSVIPLDQPLEPGAR
ncbi:hypothetical protein RM844_03430 [Streptomyces sp. DSM 44915]|uniref:Uncharacterized protein n=1 Tax=Streptomyces chisholmiae TaxID=3075540 RepID=A0ABU2JLF1_9ACTN|nr:hypothetical protein [Streptomyces sp. DSM 44915]MDT0265339.1 hypothetical protein [Streptomyces sp. DSM 44915]